MTGDPVVRFENVDIVFGDDPGSALPLIDRGESRDAIQKATGQILGVAGADVTAASLQEVPLNAPRPNAPCQPRGPLHVVRFSCYAVCARVTDDHDDPAARHG